MAKGGSVLLKIIDLVALILTVCAGSALILAYLTPYINPNKIWALAYFGLAAPILYTANLLLMLYWACRWSPVFFISAGLVLLGVPQVKKYYHLPFSKNYAENLDPGNFKIMTFNVGGFVEFDEEAQRSFSTTPPIVGYIKEVNPDIVCLQEYQSTPYYPQTMIDTCLAAWPHRYVGYNVTGIIGIAIYSKFPILSAEKIEFEESYNGVVHARLLIGKQDTLRLICNHLETTYVDKNNVAFLDSPNFSNETDKKGKIRQIAQRLRKGFRKRAFQADTVASVIAGSQLPTIVCGDFNDTPTSYAYRTIRGSYGDSFEDKGSGYGYTYKKLYRFLRIDYILRSPGIETLSYESPEVDWSDHNPIIGTFRRKENP